MRTASRAGRIAFVCSLGIACSAFALEPGQLPPTRLYAIGDSLTRAANANLPGDNLSASWVSGYHGFWQELFGLPDVNSHNQRITAIWGREGRRNWIAARNGAHMHDFVGQTASVPHLNVTYATVLLGANDLCRDSPADLPTDAEFEARLREGLTTLTRALPEGATVLVAAIPKVSALWELGQSKTALGITNCPTLWRITGFCKAVTNDTATEADRLYIDSRNVGYNRILQIVTDETAALNPGKFVRFAPRVYELPYAESHISDLDCFHASWRGQRAVAEITWPF